jgi:glutathione synthase/RimK-type ligase-like ATP-grasp enzyme
MRIALATAEHLPGLSPDDQVLFEVLRERGVDVSAAVWDEDQDWSKFQTVVTRSIWDYHLKYPRYLRWLDDLDTAGVSVHNPTDVQRWNADKHYMLDVEARGVSITPTIVNPSSLQEGVKASGWERVVVKPTVASTGYETWLIDAADAEKYEQQYGEQRKRMDVLVQEFAPGVAKGEMSFVFLGGEYSHAVLKRAAGDEFRIHVEHGGSVESFEPSTSQIDWASSVIDAIHEPWSYARVDAVSAEGGLVLMELEMLDPELFFLYDRKAAERFADIICK